MSDDDLVYSVVARIYARRPPFPEDMAVSAEEFDACERAVRQQLAERGDAPFPYTRTGRGILFKNVEIYVE